VRGLIVFVIVVGAGLGWIVREAHVQRDAVAAIRIAGGTVQYDWEWRDGMAIPRGKPPAPRWLIDLIGDDYFGHVTVVGFSVNSSVTDATFAEVGHLTRVEELFVSSENVCDARPMHLLLTKLNRLDLHDTRVTDAGLRHLNGLTSLSHLWLYHTRVTHAGIEELKQAVPGLMVYH
jgi:hypothetical protein